ncbi:hypothetical protein BJ508DRAFT_359901 [Ascobolus immersus RN42]|uniref:Uncharacterized protein n=1 Tax=Ascobolus immersus RN42 TaxID=1160509 RepID=A0A3N4IJ68_ASCIM|nr:hypothetical protein BJ508DRAFT_359901 [Ascobolus immersus RN42]
MTTFLTLPLDLHYHIAAYLLPLPSPHLHNPLLISTPFPPTDETFASPDLHMHYALTSLLPTHGTSKPLLKLLFILGSPLTFTKPPAQKPTNSGGAAGWEGQGAEGWWVGRVEELLFFSRDDCEDEGVWNTRGRGEMLAALVEREVGRMGGRHAGEYEKAIVKAYNGIIGRHRRQPCRLARRRFAAVARKRTERLVVRLLCEEE